MKVAFTKYNHHPFANISDFLDIIYLPNFLTPNNWRKILAQVVVATFGVLHQINLKGYNQFCLPIIML